MARSHKKTKRFIHRIRRRQRAGSHPGAGIATGNASINIDAWAKDGWNFVMTGGNLLESGDYELIGTNSWVSVGGQLRATSLTSGSSGFPYQAADFIQTSDSLDTVGQLTDWDASAALNFSSVAGWTTDSGVKFTIQNLLRATTLDTGELAFVEKKFVGVDVTVPLPASAWLFFAAMLGLVCVKRKEGAAAEAA